MGKILIFKEIRDRALDNKLDNLVLFGEKGYINDTNNTYDLIFYSKQIILPYCFEKPCSLVIPVIRTFNEKEAIEKIHDLNEQFPDFNRFVVSGEFLDFYAVIKGGLGKEIKSLGKYNVVDSDKLVEYSKDPVFEQKIEQQIRKINNNYKISCN